MKSRISGSLAIAAMALSACAQKAEKITPAYVSPLAYQDYSCRQIAAEASRISQRAARMAGVQNKQATNDAVATGVAIVLLWPAAFLIKGDEQTAAEDSVPRRGVGAPTLGEVRA